MHTHVLICVCIKSYICSHISSSCHVYLYNMVISTILKLLNCTSGTKQRENELHSHSLLSSLCFSFQVPRKVVFCHHRGNKQPPNPPKTKEPTEPTSSSRLPALVSSAHPDSPWEKVASPPPHEPQGSDMPVFMHVKGNSASVCAAHARSQMRYLQKVQPQ